MMRAASFALALLAGLPTLRAEEGDLGAGRVVAVDPRPYHLVHEFSVSAGVLPLDAFYTGFSLGGSYTLHFSDILAWEAAGFHYFGNLDTGLEKELGERWSVAPFKEPEVRYVLGSHLVLTPLYGKFALFNRSVVEVSTYVALGGGLIRFDDGFRPAASAGPGVRLFFGEIVSARLDLRNGLVPDVPRGVEYILHLTLSMSFNFGKTRATELAVTEAREAERTTGFETLDELFPGTRPPGGDRGRERE